MLYRKLKEDDYKNYLELINDFRDTNYSEQEFIDNFNKIIKYSDIWLIEEDNKLICTATIIYEIKFIFNICKSAHIEDVCTKKEFRGLGYGKKLIKFLINEATLNNCYKINLVCNNNTSYFYKKSGFEERGVHMSLLLPK